MTIQNFSGVENLEIIKTKIADLEGFGTETDGQFRPTKKALFATNDPSIFSVYTSPNAHSEGGHTLLKKSEIIENYSIFKIGTRFPIEI